MSASSRVVDVRSGVQVRGARLVTGAYALGALVAAGIWLSEVVTHSHRVGWVELLFELFNVPVGPSVVSVVVLVLTVRMLLGRKRIGLLVVAACQLLGCYDGVVSLLELINRPTLWTGHDRALLSRRLDVVSIGVGLLLLAWLWSLRPAFPGRLRRGSWPASGIVLGAGGALSWVLTWVLVARFGPQEGSRLRATRAAVAAALGDHDRDTAGVLTELPRWIPQLTAVLVSVTIIAAVVVFVRSADDHQAWSAERELALRELLARYGDRDSLGYFATRRDKSSVFSPNRRAAVTYRVISGVCLASGDPVGDPSAWDGAIDRWLADASRYGWIPAVLGASEEGARAFARRGLQVLALGDEAILDPARFSLSDSSMTPVRHAVRRATRAGLEVRTRRQRDIPAAELAELHRCAEMWRGDEPERGFSMALNREADPADEQILFVTARGPDGGLVGLLSFVPWGRSRISLDLMRRDPQAPNGCVELMTTHVLTHADDLGVRAVSLNFCMFRSVYTDAARLGSRPLTHLNHTMLGFFDRFWQLERLYRSNQKFDPRWYPRFVCFSDWVSLPQVALAAGQAEGFVPTWPRPATTSARLTAAELDAVRELNIRADRPAGVRRSDQTRHRLTHLARLERAGRPGYPAGDGVPPASPAQVLDAGVEPGAPLRLTGRIGRLRDHGAVLFVDLTDGERQVQVVLEAGAVGRAAVREAASCLDGGDLVRVDGHWGASRRGEPSLLAERWDLLAKALHPVPYGRFDDPYERARRRAVDLLAHPDGARLLRRRSAIVAGVRSTLSDAGFLEVETPVLQYVHGGASARPFRTHINAYDCDLSLRIAPELFLKRLLVAGVGPVFEIARNFRNEGVDRRHNPEFTSVEAYLPGADYADMARLAERIIVGAAARIGLRLEPDWPRVPMLEAVSAAVGEPVSVDSGIDRLIAIAVAHDVRVRPHAGPGQILEDLYGDLVEAATTAPTFYVDFPQETSPLTRGHRRRPGLVERWDLVMGGIEIGTGYTELTDPVEQRRRLTEQSWKASGGDAEAMQVDEGFLADLEVGMPPAGGLGIGIDRLAMTLLGVDIRSVLSFPFVRPKVTADAGTGSDATAPREAGAEVTMRGPGR